MSGPSAHLRLQIDVGKGHLCNLVETQREGDCTEDKECVVDGHSHQDYGLGLCVCHLDQESAGQINHQEK